jgi:RimJ/RimL family protein N-acetyltransferase
MIRGERVVLRTVREEDLDALYDFMSDVAARGDYFPVRIVSQTAFRREFHETGFFTGREAWLLICTTEGEVVGRIWYTTTLPHPDAIQIGYHTFDPGRRGRGYVSEALELLVAHLFATTKVTRLQGLVIPGNVPSRRVAEKCGFQSEGILRGPVFVGGASRDLELFSLLKDTEAQR